MRRVAQFLGCEGTTKEAKMVPPKESGTGEIQYYAPGKPAATSTGDAAFELSCTSRPEDSQE